MGKKPGGVWSPSAIFKKSGVEGELVETEGWVMRVTFGWKKDDDKEIQWAIEIKSSYLGINFNGVSLVKLLLTMSHY